MSQLRRDVLTGEWVIIAKERDGRPYHFDDKPHEQECPFCPGNEHMTPGETLRIENVRAVPNKFPAVCRNNEPIKNGLLFYTACEGTGCHEVIIETPQHDRALHELGQQDIYHVFCMYQKRFMQLSQEEKIAYVQVFKNHGRNGGASISHAHSQVVALPFIPPRLAKEMKGCEEYFNKTGRCVSCDVLKEELESQERMIYRNDSFAVSLAFAPRFAYETVFIPMVHQPDYSMVNEQTLWNLADAFEHTMYKMVRVLGEFPYNLVLHTAPYRSEATYYHWHLELIPRVSYHAGFEIATDTCINSICPEEAAERIRNENKPFGK